MNFKIILLFVIISLISTTILYVINDWYLAENDKERIHNPIFSEYIDDFENKIYLIGDSQVGRINHNFMTNYIQSQGYDFYVYRLAVPGSSPSDKLPIINKIIETDPKIVVITTDIQQFVNPKIKVTLENQIIGKPKNTLLDPQAIFRNFLSSYDFLKIDWNNFKNPKLTTLNLVQNIFDTGKITKINFHFYASPLALDNKKNLLSSIEYPEISKTEINKTSISKNIDAFKIKNPQQIMTFEEVQYVVNKRPFRSGISIENNENYNSIKKMIESFHQNDIKVILIIMPRPQQYIETIPEQDLKNFQYLLSKLKNNTGVEANSLLEEYANVGLWGDSLHVTANNKGLIFSEDTAKIIVKAIET